MASSRQGIAKQLQMGTKPPDDPVRSPGARIVDIDMGTVNGTWGKSSLPVDAQWWKETGGKVYLVDGFAMV